MRMLEALRYPFQKQNLMNTVLIPAGLSTVSGIFMMLAIVAVAALSISAIPLPNTGPLQYIHLPQLSQYSSLFGIGGFGFFIISLALGIPVLGYNWELIHNWQVYGLGTPAPQWRGNWKNYYQSGSQAAMAGFILAVPITLAAIPLGLFVPFLLASFFLAASERTCASVIKNIVPGINLTSQHLGKVLIGYYISVGISICGSMIAGLFSWTLIGAPLVIAVSSIVGLYMLTSSFSTFATSLHEPYQIPDKVQSEPGNLDNITDVEGEAMMVYENLNRQQEVNNAPTVMMNAYTMDDNPWLKQRSS